MKNIFKYFLIFTLFLSLSFSAFAQDPPVPASEGMHWFCLSAPVAEANPGAHTAKLYVKEGTGWQADKDAYVVVRIALSHDTQTALEMDSDSDSAMTTADPGLDQIILGGTAGLVRLQTELGFANAGVEEGNPVRMSMGTPITWKDDLIITMEEEGFVDRAHYWYGVQEAIPVEAMGAGAAGGQQQGTFTFDTAGSAKDCDVIRWDPFGYVFDAQTHGAVAGVYVRLLSSPTVNGTYTPVPVGVGVGKVPQNPIATQKDGSYRYYVDPGYYKLELLGDVAKSNTKYTIEKSLSNIKPGYEEFGYEQVYIAEKPEPILEVAGKVERRDIAIETIGAPAPFSIDGPKLKDIIINRATKNSDQFVRITGMATSIPIEFTAVYKDANNAVIKQEKYVLSHGHKYVPTGLHDERNFDIWMSATTPDGKGTFTELKVSSKYSNKVFSIAISPMPSYLNGIARTKNGLPIVGGTVEVYPIGVNKPSFTATTDESGHFVVNTEWIPPFPYELRYTTATGDKIKVTTTEYLKQNETYHEANKIDSYTVKVSNPDTNTAKKNTSINTNAYSNNRVQPTATTRGGIAATGMQGIIIVVMVLFILIGIGVGAFFMMKSKQSQMPPLS